MTLQLGDFISDCRKVIALWVSELRSWKALPCILVLAVLSFLPIRFYKRVLPLTCKSWHETFTSARYWSIIQVWDLFLAKCDVLSRRDGRWGKFASYIFEESASIRIIVLFHEPSSRCNQIFKWAFFANTIEALNLQTPFLLSKTGFELGYKPVVGRAQRGLFFRNQDSWKRERLVSATQDDKRFWDWVYYENSTESLYHLRRDCVVRWTIRDGSLVTNVFKLHFDFSPDFIRNFMVTRSLLLIQTVHDLSLFEFKSSELLVLFLATDVKVDEPVRHLFQFKGHSFLIWRDDLRIYKTEIKTGGLGVREVLCRIPYDDDGADVYLDRMGDLLVQGERVFLHLIDIDAWCYFEFNNRVDG